LRNILETREHGVQCCAWRCDARDAIPGWRGAWLIAIIKIYFHFSIFFKVFS